ncbi:protein mono-ADP-ribosyltransferase PARP3-like [Oenanthe melanoleuca]|uniref:protein mono-ADP-ribosyltransferase PARP3-like n=1 Tax=Oenanthe melanoleuca TaxID=2939378 RepID=UPI0024C1A762|nr:protein mono-ADP-ribosyltransferase PARP3-like [Oenanthe melanoleuca]
MVGWGWLEGRVVSGSHVIRGCLAKQAVQSLEQQAVQSSCSLRRLHVLSGGVTAVSARNPRVLPKEEVSPLNRLPVQPEDPCQLLAGSPGQREQPESREEETGVRYEEDTWSSTLAMLKTAPKEKPPAIIDARCALSIVPDARVYEDYDCTLNQTNISDNTNKFIIIQLLEYNGSYGVWKHSGRVGYEGLSKPITWKSLDAAKEDFEELFHTKTKNSWDRRENYDAQTGKYKLIEVEQEVDLTRAGGGGSPQDVKKMPLGKLSKQQIARGFEALEELEVEINKLPPNAAQLEKYSSRFYTIIPHDFAKDTPPTINSPDLLRAKKDMLLVLAKNALAQSLQAQKMKKEEEKEVSRLLDQDYPLLCSQLSQLKSNDEIQEESMAQSIAQDRSGCS